MTLEGVLFALIVVSIPGDWLVFTILFREAVRRPFLPALVLMAMLTGLISLALTAYALAVVNASVGFALPREITQVTLRASFLGFALFPFLFLWIYRSGRFGT